MMGMPVPVSGFVLAGGRSSRMGRDKALLQLAGKPLVEHAVTKLKRVCGEVRILSSDPALAGYAPLVEDVHRDCGPLGGVEAALMASATDWNLVLPVDVPFLPTGLLEYWLGAALNQPMKQTRVSILSSGGVAHPALVVIHREMLPYLRDSLDRGQFRLLAALEHGAEEIATRARVETEFVFYRPQMDDSCTTFVGHAPDIWGSIQGVPEGTFDFWFANLNTREEFSEAERLAGGLERLEEPHLMGTDWSAG